MLDLAVASVNVPRKIIQESLILNTPDIVLIEIAFFLWPMKYVEVS